jgi:hypothetical protein
VYIEADANYGDPYAIAEDDEDDGEEALLFEDGDGVLLAHAVEPVKLERDLLFIDGVRRTDFRAHEVLDDGQLARGLGGTYGVGAVRCRASERPEFVDPVIERLLFWTHGHRGSLPETSGWWWAPVALATTDLDALLASLQDQMRAAEADLAALYATDGALVVRDGPLNRLYGTDVDVVGLVKSHHHRYLPAELHRDVPDVIAAPGERTSLFRLRDDMWGTYLRLPATGRVGPWGGIVRLDVPAAAGRERAVEMTDEICGLLPRYAGVAHVDPRAPANLQPIGALESRLRHQLGDQGGALRAARVAAARADTPDGTPPSRHGSTTSNRATTPPRGDRHEEHA